MGMTAASSRRIAKRIKEVRGDRSQRQFAKQIGVKPQNISRYEMGLLPHIAFLFVIHAMEGISANWLLFGKGPKKIGPKKTRA